MLLRKEKKRKMWLWEHPGPNPIPQHVAKPRYRTHISPSCLSSMQQTFRRRPFLVQFFRITTLLPRRRSVPSRIHSPSGTCIVSCTTIFTSTLEHTTYGYFNAVLNTILPTHRGYQVIHLLSVFLYLPQPQKIEVQYPLRRSITHQYGSSQSSIGGEYRSRTGEIPITHTTWLRQTLPNTRTQSFSSYRPRDEYTVS